MNPEKAWRRYQEAEDAYDSVRAALLTAEYEPVTRRALNTAAGRGTALRLLADAPPERLMDFFDVLLPVAASTHPDLALVRRMLASLDPGWVYTNMVGFVEQVVTSSESGWEEFRRLAELLDALGQTQLLDTLVKAAASSDEDIREVAEDFS